MVTSSARITQLADERLLAVQEAARRTTIDPIGESYVSSLARLLACSDFAYQILLRRPELANELINSGHLEKNYCPGHYQGSIGVAVSAASDEEQLLRTLREQKRREMLRIAWRDICGYATFEETVSETSDYADAILQASLNWLHQRLCDERGTPSAPDGTPQEMIVLALGKLGAQELNFSSDIDLIFCFRHSGHTVGAKRELSNDEFFIRLARRFINVLSKTTEDGFVFRVDMRLRPFGASGPLVSTLAAMEDYYQIHGRDWERYAFIRARPVAGDIAGGELLLNALRPFVYRRYLDFGALESLRDMKAMIRSEVSRNNLQSNIKLGSGGIREIEFVGQAFQMVRGGRIAELRGGKLLPVLQKLAERSFLPGYSVHELSDAYRYLRTVEHRLQQVDDQQTHSLPEDEIGRERLCFAMNTETWASLIARIDKCRERVQSHFDQIFGPPQSQTANETDSLSHYWSTTASDEELIRALRDIGFEDPEPAADLLSKLHSSYAIRALGERGQQRFARLMPLLLRAVAHRENALVALRRVLRVIESIARRSVYLSLLIERPLALAQLVKLCAASSMVSHQFARHPLILDELLDARSLYTPLLKEALLRDVTTRLASVSTGDVEQEMDALRQFKQANMLRIAAADVAKSMTVSDVSTRLTELAEVCLQSVLDLSYRDMVSRYGRPCYRENGVVHDAPFAIIAYGKFGSRELGYGSDLDLVFLHDSRGEEQHTRGDKVVENSVFFVRLAQRVIHMLSTHTSDGTLYASDTRLRPSGSDGLLVTGLESFSSYQLEQAWVWEHQALVRARFVAGNHALGERFAAVRRRVLTSKRDPQVLRREVRDMRLRMRNELGTKTATAFDLKQDDGGIADIEFVVQYVALRWSEELGEALQSTETQRLLRGAESLGLMESQDTEVLLEAYERYRARVHALSLQEEAALVPPAEFESLRKGVRRVWQKIFD